jgi:hypothetical protein
LACNDDIEIKRNSTPTIVSKGSTENGNGNFNNLFENDNTQRSDNHQNKKHGAGRLPIVIVPPLMGSVLEVRKSESKPKWEGHRVWLALKALINKKLGAKHKNTDLGGAIDNSNTELTRHASINSNSSLPNVKSASSSLRRISSSKNHRRNSLPASSDNVIMFKNPGMNRDTTEQACSKARRRKTLAGFTSLKNKSLAQSHLKALPELEDFPQQSRHDSLGSSEALNIKENMRKKQIVRTNSFVLSHHSTQSELAKAHPLVRHITLGSDGVSDPPGIRVRARRGLKSIL